MRRRAAEPVEVSYLTDPLCPWSWSMEPTVSAFHANLSSDIEFRLVMTGWFPGPALRSAESAKQEWQEASAKTGAVIDPAYWDRVGPKTTLLACAAVRSADFQGAAKGLDYLAALRHAIFRADADPTNSDALTAAAKASRLDEKLFLGDLGAGRYTVEDVVSSLDPSMPLAEAVSWFARRRMLRSWEALAEDLKSAQEWELASPAFRVARGKKEVKLRGIITAGHLDRAIASVR